MNWELLAKVGTLSATMQPHAATRRNGTKCTIHGTGKREKYGVMPAIPFLRR